MGSPSNARQSDHTRAVYRTGERPHAVVTRVHQKVAEDSQRRPRSRSATVTSRTESDLNPAHIGSDFEDFLKEEGLFAEVQVLAVKELLAYRIQTLMRQERLTKDALAKRMKTSRAALDRLLDPDNPSVTLATLGKAACALGRTLQVELTEARR
jgi:antitoxin HicB